MKVRYYIFYYKLKDKSINNNLDSVEIKSKLLINKKKCSNPYINNDNYDKNNSCFDFHCKNKVKLSSNIDNQIKKINNNKENVDKYKNNDNFNDLKNKIKVKSDLLLKRTDKLFNEMIRVIKKQYMS